MNIQNHKSARKDIRRVILELRKKFPSLSEGAKICGTCRRKTSNFCKEELTSTSESDNPEIVSKVITFWTSEKVILENQIKKIFSQL